MTDELVTWLRAQLADDEQRAGFIHHVNCGNLIAQSYELPDPCDCREPARVLAEVQAKRRIIDLHDLQVQEHPARFDSLSGERIGPEYEVTCGVCGWASMDPTSACETLRLLTLPHAHRDGFQAEWAPDEEENHG